MNEMTNVTTGEVRFSYVHVFKPYSAMQGQDERYSVTILVPKSDAVLMRLSKRQSREVSQISGAASARRSFRLRFMTVTE